MTTIALVQSDAEIENRDPVMAELTRPLGGEAAFLERVRRQLREGGYRLFSVHDAGAVVAVVGFPASEWLGRGKAMPVDDLGIGAFHFRLPLQGPGDGQGQ